MKVKIIKILLRAFVLMLAVCSAFAFKSVENKTLLAFEIGYINLTGQPCAIPVECDNTLSDFVCTAIYQGVQRQTFGKTNEFNPVCDRILFRLSR